MCVGTLSYLIPPRAYAILQPAEMRVRPIADGRRHPILDGRMQTPRVHCIEHLNLHTTTARSNQLHLDARKHAVCTGFEVRKNTYRLGRINNAGARPIGGRRKLRRAKRSANTSSSPIPILRSVAGYVQCVFIRLYYVDLRAAHTANGIRIAVSIAATVARQIILCH